MLADSTCRDHEQGVWVEQYTAVLLAYPSVAQYESNFRPENVPEDTEKLFFHVEVLCRFCSLYPPR